MNSSNQSKSFETQEATQAHALGIHWGPAGRIIMPLFAIGSLLAWAIGGVALLLPALGSALWLVALWQGLRQSRGIALRALPTRPHWNGEAFLFELELSTRGASQGVRRDLIVSRSSNSLRRSRNASQRRPIGHLGRLPARSATVIHCGHRSLQRGRENSLSLILHSQFPFGLLRVERHYKVPVDMLTWPRLGRWRGPLVQAIRRSEQSGPIARQRGEEEFLQLTPWRPGMPPRGIHWKQSARRGRWLMQEREGPSMPPVRVELLLQVPAPGGRTGTSRASFEAAVCLAGTLVEHHLQAGLSVSLVCGTQELSLLHGRSGRWIALGVLSEVSSTEVEADDFPAYLRAALQRTPNQLVVARGKEGHVVDARGTQGIQLLDAEDVNIDRWYRRGVVSDRGETTEEVA